MIFLRAYEYFFYKIFKSIEYTSYPKFWSQWKAIAFIIMLQIWILCSIDTCYHYYIEVPISTSNNFLETYQIVSIIVFVGLNWFLFEYQNKWEEIVARYDKLSDKKNLFGGIVVWAVILFIIIFYWFFAIDLLSKVSFE